MMSDNITIRIAEMSDRQDIVDFMKRAFYPQEPLSIADGTDLAPTEVDINSSLRQLNERTSLLALDNSSGKIIGSLMCGDIFPSEVQALQEEAATCGCPKFQKVLNLLATMEKNGGHYWKDTGAQKALSLYSLAVDPEVRRLGVGRKLVERAKLLAIDQGYELVHVDCSSMYSIHLAEKLGMECIYILKYEDFKDESGKPYYVPPPPHSEMRKYILKLRR